MGNFQFSLLVSAKKKIKDPFSQSTQKINGLTKYFSFLHHLPFDSSEVTKKWRIAPRDGTTVISNHKKKKAKTLVNLPKFAPRKSRNRIIIPAFTIMV